MNMDTRVLLLHKQGTSGRLRYLRLPSGVALFTPLPADAALRPEDWSPTVQVHPSAVLREAEVRLGLAEGAIEAVPEFQCWVDTSVGDVAVLLGAFASIDPPFAAAEQLDGRFIAIAEARSLSAIERDLMRRAYEHVLG
ncbi:MAG: hypothetical protein KGZ68_14730 [Dechloromonas sp.]|jgi:hypothetical protein|nr:hypothetical protein [Dechloromonas sp.]